MFFSKILFVEIEMRLDERGKFFKREVANAFFLGLGGEVFAHSVDVDVDKAVFVRLCIKHAAFGIIFHSEVEEVVNHIFRELLFEFFGQMLLYVCHGTRVFGGVCQEFFF